MFVPFFNAFITKMCGRNMFYKLGVPLNLIDFAAANEEICLLFSFLFFFFGNLYRDQFVFNRYRGNLENQYYF